MSEYRKKPVVIEAEAFNVVDEPLPFSGRGDPCCYDGKRWYIATLEGDHQLTPGDMVIRGVKGEFYPCKPDIFAATYEPVAALRSRDERVRVLVEAARAVVDNTDTQYPGHLGYVRCDMWRIDALCAALVAYEKEADDA